MNYNDKNCHIENDDKIYHTIVPVVENEEIIIDDQIYPENYNDEPGSSNSMSNECDRTEYLKYLLSKQNICVQEVGRVIYNGIIDGSLKEDELTNLAKNFSKNVNLGNLDIVSLTNQIHNGIVGCRLAIIGNAFMWNVLKSCMMTVRDKCDNFNYKISAMSETSTDKLDFNSNNVAEGQFRINPGGYFQDADLYHIYKMIAFRKTGDVIRKAKQFIKTYFVESTQPKCAIWHFGLRLSGSSHKKTIVNVPMEIVSILIDFLLTLCGIPNKELDCDIQEIDVNKRFFQKLSKNDDEMSTEIVKLKNLRDSLVAKFRVCITDTLNEIREMPYDLDSKELVLPVRKQSMPAHYRTFKQYEDLIKKCLNDPTRENIKEKQEIENQLEYAFEIVYEAS